MPSSRDNFRRNRVAPVGTNRIPLWRMGRKIGGASLFHAKLPIDFARVCNAERSLNLLRFFDRDAVAL